MDELEFFCWWGLDSNIVEPIKSLEKIRKLNIQIQVVILKVTSCRTMRKKQNWRKVKNQDSMGKTNFFVSTLPFNPWAIFATWLHVGVPQKIQKNWTYNPFWTKIHHGLIQSAWYCRKACKICSSHIQKGNFKNIYFSFHRLSKHQTTNFWSQGILGVKHSILVGPCEQPHPKVWFLSKKVSSPHPIEDWG
jgi:hypothetical protein